MNTGGASRFALYAKKLRPNDHISGNILTTKRVMSAGAINSGPRRSELISQPRKPAALRDADGLAARLVAVSGFATEVIFMKPQGRGRVWRVRNARVGGQMRSRRVR